MRLRAPVARFAAAVAAVAAVAVTATTAALVVPSAQAAPRALASTAAEEDPGWTRVLLDERADHRQMSSLANLGDEAVYGLTIDNWSNNESLTNTDFRITGWRADGTVVETPWDWQTYSSDQVGGLAFPTGLEGGPDGNLYALSYRTDAAKWSVHGSALLRFVPGETAPEVLWLTPFNSTAAYHGIAVGPDLSIYVAPRHFETQGLQHLYRFTPGSPTPTVLPEPGQGWYSLSEPEIAPDGTIYVTGIDGDEDDPTSRKGLWSLAPGADTWDLLHELPLSSDISRYFLVRPLHVTRSGLVVFSPDFERIDVLDPATEEISTIGVVPENDTGWFRAGALSSDPHGAIYAGGRQAGPLYRFVPPPAAQQISFDQPADLAVGGADGVLSASAPGGPVAFTSGTPQVCTVSGSSVHPVAVGTCSITATQGGGPYHLPADPVTRTLTVQRASQTITFPQPADLTYGDAPVTLTATASSGLPVTFATSTPASCTVTGTSLTVVGAGTCTVVAQQPGDTQHEAAEPVVRSVSIAKAAQTVSFAPPANTVFEGADVPLSATASSGLPVSFTSQTPAVCSIVNGKAHPTGAGTCTIAASQPGNGNYLAAVPVTRSLKVAKAPITVTTRSTSSLVSLLTLRVTYTTVVTSAATGAPVAGVPVTTRIDGGTATSGCTATTSATGVATCTVGPIGIALLTTYKANAAETTHYQAGTAAGRTPLL